MTRALAPVVLFVSTLALAGCVHPVFHEPTTISTRSLAVQDAKPIETVSADLTDLLILIIPIPSDPRDIYDELLEKAKEAGGNAVIDVQVRNRSTFWFIPLVWVQKTEAVGVAARVGPSGPTGASP